MPTLSKTLIVASLILSVLAQGGGHAPRTHHKDVSARYVAPDAAVDAPMAPHARRMRKVRHNRGPGGPGEGPDTATTTDVAASATAATTTATTSATTTTATTSFLSGTQTGEGELNCSCSSADYCANTLARHILCNGPRRLRYHKHGHRLHHRGFETPI